MYKIAKWSLALSIVAFLCYAGYMINFGMKTNFIRVGLGPYYDKTPELLPPMSGEISVLVFSKTNSWRHYDAIDAANELFENLGEDNNWAIYQTENGAVHNLEDLSKFDVVIWQNVTGDVLLENQRAALRSWVEDGGSWMGIHGSAGTTELIWDWYVNELIGVQFIGHNESPQFIDAIVSKDHAHPVTEGIPDQWMREEEYYSFDESVRNKAEVLLNLDESSIGFELEHPMGDDHPLAWIRKVGKGTSLYSALGHKPEYYKDELHIQMIKQAIIWLAAENSRPKTIGN